MTINLFELVLTSPKGEKQSVAFNVPLHKQPDTLKNARKFFFGKKGKISYTNCWASHDGYTLAFEQQEYTKLD